RGGVHSALGGAGRGPGRGDVALVLVQDWERDADAAAEVVEDVLNGPDGAARGEPVEREAEVLALIAEDDARVPAPLRLLPADLGYGHRAVRASGPDITAPGERLVHGTRPVDRGRRRGQLAAQRERHVRLHTHERLELRGEHVDPAREELLARVEPVHLHLEQALLE